MLYIVHNTTFFLIITVSKNFSSESVYVQDHLAFRTRGKKHLCSNIINPNTQTQTADKLSLPILVLAYSLSNLTDKNVTCLNLSETHDIPYQILCASKQVDVNERHESCSRTDAQKLIKQQKQFGKQESKKLCHPKDEYRLEPLRIWHPDWETGSVLSSRSLPTTVLDLIERDSSLGSRDYGIQIYCHQSQRHIS